MRIKKKGNNIATRKCYHSVWRINEQFCHEKKEEGGELTWVLCRYRAEQYNSFHCLQLYIRGKKSPFFIFCCLYKFYYDTVTRPCDQKKKNIKDGISASFMYLPSFIKTTHPGGIITKKPHRTISQNLSTAKHILKNPLWAWISARHEF